MSERLTSQDVQSLLASLRKAVQTEECWTCDCLQGFLVQMEMDAEPAAAGAIEPLRVPPARMHGCLGCDPCPPAAAFADYLRAANAQGNAEKQSRKGCPCCHPKQETRS